MHSESEVIKPPPSHVRRWLYMLSSVLIGALFLYLTARNVDLEQALATIYAINGWWIMPLTLVYILTFILRGLRWQLMFPDESRPSLRHAIDAFMIGRVCNNFLPGRLGELIRATVMGKILPRVGLSGSVATIVLEKIFDAFAVLVLLGVALFFAPLPPWLSNAGLAMIIVLPAMLLALVIVDKADAHISHPSEGATSAGIIVRLMAFVRQILQKFSTGLFALRTAHHFTLLSALTLFIWGWEVIILFICLQAFSIPVPFTAALVTLVFLCVGSMLPAAPGFIGTYQLFIVAALQLYSIPDTNAFALSVFLNLYVIILTLILGVVAILLEGGIFNLKQVLSSIMGRP